jgi:hypothetical protein
VRACLCATGNPADYDGPARECPQHGDVTARYGLNRGPHLLGRSYSAMDVRVAAVRRLAVDQGTDDQALHLLADALHVVTSPNNATDLITRLRTLISRAADWETELFAPEER